jgi:transketolase
MSVVFNIEHTKKLARDVSISIVELAHKHKASHVGGALSITDVLCVLYSSVLNVTPGNVEDKKRDRLYYSKGHACTALYCILAELNFFSKKELFAEFTTNGSFFTSHVNHKIEGIELSTGSLGHALSVACGSALASKRNENPWRVFAILSDGELNEGSNWEAILFASHHKLNNLHLVIDYNKIQSLGNTNEVLNLEPLTEKFESFGWEVMNIDGHNHSEIYEAFHSWKTIDKPRVIIARTIKGKGVPFMENQLAWHYKSPSNEDVLNAIYFINSNS